MTPYVEDPLVQTLRQRISSLEADFVFVCAHLELLEQMAEGDAMKGSIKRLREYLGKIEPVLGGTRQ